MLLSLMPEKFSKKYLMNIASINRRIFFIFSILLVLMIVTISTAWWRTTQTTISWNTAKQNFSRQRTAAYRSIENADFLKTNSADYRILEEHGMIGSLDRIEWVDALESISEGMALSQFQYEMSPAEVVEQVQARQVELSVVHIRLRIGFAHDGGIFEFFEALSDRIVAGFEVRKLEIVRVENHTGADAVGNGGSIVNLKVMCEIDWYSISPVNNSSKTDV